MCGIAGIVRFDGQPIDIGRLDRMHVHMQHRGPDGSGHVVLDRCAMTHARLSIIDHDGGQQPMVLPETNGVGELTVVFNGEIYNHRRLRKTLEKFGHHFSSDHSDTEVLLHGYRQWGEQLPMRLNGMFAFAIWDSAARRLFMCRDRIGKKPLYIMGRNEAGKQTELAFANLVGSLIAGRPPGPSIDIDRHALQVFLRLGYTQSHSLIKGVEELPPGCSMTVEPDGQSRMKAYWQAPAVSKTDTARGVVTAVHELIEDAVATRLEADVPLGAFLSRRHRFFHYCRHGSVAIGGRGAGPLKTFAVRMTESEYDESPYASQVANHIGSDHAELVASPSGQLMDDIDHLMGVMGEPTADSSILPTYWLSQATRNHVKVALSGDGGDELFGGYDRYRAMRLINRYKWWINQMPAHWVERLAHTEPRSMSAKLRRFLAAAELKQPADQYLSMIHLFDDARMKAIGFDPNGDGQSSSSLPPHADWPHELKPVQAAMRWDLTHYLPNDLLRKVDRASMAVGLEVRSPLLDTQVAELQVHLPASVLMRGGRPKSVLRDIAAKLLPPSIAERPKRGFAIPIGQWMRGPLRDALSDRIVDGTLTDLGFNRFAIEQMIESHVERKADHTHRLFAMLTLSSWARWLKQVAA